MKRMTAVKPLTYRTRRLKAGEEFEASRRDAKILTAIGKAKPVPECKPEAAPASAPADATLFGPGEAGGEPETPAPPEPEPVEEPTAGPDIPDREALGRLTNAELRALAGRIEGVVVTGKETKAELVDRIDAARAGNGEA
ncbi:MAG: hypothetical protein ACLFPA_09260 [Dichotomicrobium sp.]